MDVYGCSEEKMTAREFLYKNLKTENEEYFGNTDENYLSYVCDAWMNDTSNSAHRFDAMKSLIGEEELKTFKILDMSSGCGSFVFYGLLNGYDVYGIEPEKWKHQFNHLKAKEKGYPDIWMKRFFSAVGESLPFKDGTFNVISTYQTLEHVQSHKRCFEEFNRILKRGGWLFIRCPDYTSFFEGHYRIPMLPLMNNSLFKIYLKILKKPTIGLDTINYITKKMVYKLIGDDDFTIYDITLTQIKDRIHHKIKINSKILAYIYLFYSKIKTMFRSESSVNLVAIKK